MLLSTIRVMAQKIISTVDVAVDVLSMPRYCTHATSVASSRRCRKAHHLWGTITDKIASAYPSPLSQGAMAIQYMRDANTASIPWHHGEKIQLLRKTKMGAMLRSLASKKDISGSGERHVKCKMKDIGTTDRLQTHKRNDEQADTNTSTMVENKRQTSFDFCLTCANCQW